MEQTGWLRIGLFYIYLVGCFSAKNKDNDLQHQRSAEEKLMSILFRNYNPSARPVLNATESVQVNIRFLLMRINDLNERSEMMVSTGVIVSEWYDERLAWSPEKHHNVNDFIIEAKNIWKPELTLINGAVSLNQEKYYEEFRAIVNYSGLVHWEPGGVYETTCKIDISYFPFDRQRCNLVIGTWAYYSGKMNLTTDVDKVELSDYQENGEWDLYKSNVIWTSFAFECCPDIKYSKVEFVVYLKRRPAYHVMKIIVPCALLSTLMMFAFWVPPSTSGKIQLGISVVLSFNVFQLSVVDSIPKTSMYYPLIGMYLTTNLTLSTLSVCLTVFVIYADRQQDCLPPLWVKKWIMHYLGRFLCMGAFDFTKNVVYKPMKPKRKKHKNNHMIEMEDLTIDNHQTIENSQTEVKWNNYGRDAMAATVEITSRTALNPKQHKEHKIHVGNDWHRLAAVLDRLFFWMVFTTIILSSAIIFGMPYVNNANEDAD
ncbi:unnamed protein product [Owenia fusiformis]|uniref:Uncharacterized protein n=1 Tax=Owenia fusiformis TaxID=6347 RepID=A0A8S4NT32_OWEFU|nr:unnamed protein product [Owenia fusiformis]